MKKEIRSDEGGVLLSVAQVCERLGVGKSTLNRLIGERKIESVKIGRRRLIPESAILKYVKRLEEES